MNSRIFQPAGPPRPDDPALVQAGALIRAGQLVVFPTETVYGLGADATDAQAVAGIFQAKGRPADNPLIVHVPDQASALDCVAGMNDLTLALAERYWPGPVTLICPKSPRIASRTSAGLDTVGIRLPGLELARCFLQACGCPVAAPSANRSGRPSPTSFAMALEELDGRVAGLIDGPDADLGLESAILYASDDRTLHLLRAGSLDPIAMLHYLTGQGFPQLTLWYQGRPLAEGLDPAAGPGRPSPGALRQLGAAAPPAAHPAPGTGLDPAVVPDSADGAAAGRQAAPAPATDGQPPAPAPVCQPGHAALPAAPGTRYRHYSPQARVVLFRDRQELAGLLAAAFPGTAGVIGVAGLPGAAPDQTDRAASIPGQAGLADQGAPALDPALPAGSSAGFPAAPDGALTGLAAACRWTWLAPDVAEYSRRLYQSFREADRQGCAVLFAWVPEGHGEYRTALRDRLQRASGALGQ